MFRALKRRMFPLSLSKSLAIVNRLKTKGGKIPHWYTKPVMDLIATIGDKPVCQVTADELKSWYIGLKERSHERKSKPLSAWTIDSYARAVRSFLNLLVASGHLEKSPWAIRLPTLPKTSKNAMSDDDMMKMVKVSARNLRDHALILVLRDSGARVGEIASMTVFNTQTERCYYSDDSKVVVLRTGEQPPMGQEVFLRGRSLVNSEKGNQHRWILFKHEAAQKLLQYLDTRLPNSPAYIWLSQDETPLTKSGIAQILGRIGQKVGAKVDNPHAFRHWFAKKLKEARVDPEIIASLMGHKNVTTYQAIYGTTEQSELSDYHTKYTDWD